MSKANPVRFLEISSKNHTTIIDEMVSDIKGAIYKHAGTIPLALAIGVLEVVKKEILEDAE